MCLYVTHEIFARLEQWCDFDKLSDPLDFLTKIMLNGFPLSTKLGIET